jgi:hypothetical protein
MCCSIRDSLIGKNANINLPWALRQHESKVDCFYLLLCPQGAKASTLAKDHKIPFDCHYHFCQ